MSDDPVKYEIGDVIGRGGMGAVLSARDTSCRRTVAMKVLKARLYEEERRKREEEQRALNAEKADIGWGSQIRSYVLQPYQMVKDLRTQHESSNPQAVLDGALQPFIEKYLLKFADTNSPAALRDS